MPYVDGVWKSECDICNGIIEDQPMKACTTRPSDPFALCSVMWTCENPECMKRIGAKPDAYWEDYAENNGLNYEG